MKTLSFASVKGTSRIESSDSGAARGGDSSATRGCFFLLGTQPPPFPIGNVKCAVQSGVMMKGFWN